MPSVRMSPAPRELTDGLTALVEHQDAAAALRSFRACKNAPKKLEPMIRLNTLLCEHLKDTEAAADGAKGVEAGHRAWRRAREGRVLMADFPWYLPAHNLTALLLASDPCEAAHPGSVEEAVELLKKATGVALHPQTFLLASAALMKLNRCTEATAAYAQAAALAVGVPATEHVVRAYGDTGDGAIHVLHRGAATLLDTLYGDNIPADGLLTLHAACFAHLPPAVCKPLSARVAFVTEHLAPGSVMSNAGPFLRRMTDALVVDVGSNDPDVPNESAIARELRAQGRLLPPDDGALVDARVGVVVCLDGCTGTLAALSYIERAAPPGAAVVAAIGYAHPTCHPRVHFRLTDRIADPPDEPASGEPASEEPASETGLELPPPEQPLYLDPCFLCWEAPAGLPRVPLRKVAGREAFVANHNFKKLSPTTLALYARVLDACPGATLTLKPTSPLTPGQREWIHTDPDLHRLALAGRVTVEDAIADHAAYFAFLSRFAVCLDCTPYTGTVTTLEALWSDIAVVTLTGNVHRARVTTSILHAVGHPEWCADDADEYVRIATHLWRAEREVGAVRTALASSSIMDHEAYTRRLRAALDPAALCQ